MAIASPSFSSAPRHGGSDWLIAQPQGHPLLPSPLFPIQPSYPVLHGSNTPQFLVMHSIRVRIGLYIGDSMQSECTSKKIVELRTYTSPLAMAVQPSVNSSMRDLIPLSTQVHVSILTDDVDIAIRCVLK